MSRWSSVAPTTGSGMPVGLAFDPGGVADRSRWSSITPSRKSEISVHVACFCSVIVYTWYRDCAARIVGREDQQAQSRRGAKGSSPGLCLRCFKETKAVRGDQMEVLEILGKSDQSGHRTPIRMSKTTGFPGRNTLSPKRGGWQGGVKNGKSLGKYAVQSGQTRSISSAFWSKSRRVGLVRSFSSNSSTRVTKRDHFDPNRM